MIRIITNVIELTHSITNVNNFADRLRHARLLRGFTQARLAKASGLSQSAVANYEAGIRQTAKEIFRLAGALRVSAIWLKEGDGSMESLPASLPALSSYRVTDQSPTQPAAAWPFQRISPDEYWALSLEDRTLIENTVAPLVASLGRKR